MICDVPPDPPPPSFAGSTSPASTRVPRGSMLRITRYTPITCGHSPSRNLWARPNRPHSDRSQPRQLSAAIRSSTCTHPEAGLRDSRAHQSGDTAAWHQRMRLDVVCLLAATCLTVRSAMARICSPRSSHCGASPDRQGWPHGRPSLIRTPHPEHQPDHEQMLPNSCTGLSL